jgi:hypothetical protein
MRRARLRTRPLLRPLALALVALLALVSRAAADGIVRESEDDEVQDSPSTKKVRMFNFASQAAGAVILDKHPANAKGYTNLLNDDKDKYGISACRYGIGGRQVPNTPNTFTYLY